MSDAGDNPENEGNSIVGSVKDRNCPYCHKLFTSSSLGRHLDLYIKEKNPKPADGVHDVDAIRKLRAGITRRQPRGSLARRNSSVPGTPTSTGNKKSPTGDSAAGSSGIPKEGQYVVDQQQSLQGHAPFRANWTSTGVMNDLAERNSSMQGSSEEPATHDQGRKPSTVQQRTMSRAVQKSQLDVRQKLTDAMDTARAAELALRELISSWRAATLHFDSNTSPFDFEPLSLDFPALTLQCLQAPPTLFSSTPHPTSTSWSLQPPGQKQFEALEAYFQEEFRKWHIRCKLAITEAIEELTYPPSEVHQPRDIQEFIRKAQQSSGTLERQVKEHLHTAFSVWEQLTPQRRTELWNLELARSVGRRQTELEKMKTTQKTLKQENINLKSQMDYLNRLQQPREFKISPPVTYPVDEDIMLYLQEIGLKKGGGVGLNLDDRHADLHTCVTRAIERWKGVITSSRSSSGMSTQRSLDEATPRSAASAPTPTMDSTPGVLAQQQNQNASQQRSSVATTNGLTDSRSATATALSVNTDETSDRDADADADAEMEEDDNFAAMNTPISKPPPQTKQQQLEVPRTRGPAQSQKYANNSMGPQGLNTGSGKGVNLMPNMSASANLQKQQQQARMSNGDYATIAQGVGVGDPMYMD